MQTVLSYIAAGIIWKQAAAYKMKLTYFVFERLSI